MKDKDEYEVRKVEQIEVGCQRPLLEIPLFSF